MKTIFSILVIALTFSCFAQTPSFEWATSIGSNTSDFDYDLLTDNSGNVYVFGTVYSTTDFDPGPGVNSYTPSGNQGVFVSKYSKNGNYLWTKTWDWQVNPTFPPHIAIDNFQNIVISGLFIAGIDADPSVNVFNLPSIPFSTGSSSLRSQICIIKLNSFGDLIWASSIANSVEAIRLNDVKFDSSGDIYISGAVQGTVDFNPDPNIENFVPDDGMGFTGYIAKYSTSGSLDWLTFFQDGATEIEEFSIDSNDNITTLCRHSYSSNAYFQSTSSQNFFIPTVSNEINSSVMRINSNGQYLSHFTFDSNVQTNGINTDGNGDVIVIIASPSSSSDIDPLASIYNVPENYMGIAKYNQNGTLDWENSIIPPISSGMPHIINDITFNSQNDIIISGNLYGEYDFDPTSGINIISSYNYPNQSVESGYICILNNSGVYQFATGVTSSGVARSRNIIASMNGEIYNSGTFSLNDDFDYTTGVSSLTSQGGEDIYLSKYILCAEIQTTDQVESCGSYTWIDGNTYNSDNFSATHTLMNSAGCDSVVTLNLTMNNPTTSIDIITACDSYNWIDGNTYTSNNNTATYVLTNSVGCDSVVTLNLTISSSSSSTDVINTCSPTTWIDGNTYTSSNSTATYTLTNILGCDSIVTLNLSINSSTGVDTQTSCGPYKWIDGITYNSNNNTATHTLTNAEGCDSIVTLDLTINNVDTGTIVNATTITSNASSGGEYQWLDCNNSYQTISGETAQNYTPDYNGSFAVEVTENGCTDTSACVLINTVEISENDEMSQISVFPNPATTIINVSTKEKIKTIELLNIQGQSVIIESGVETLNVRGIRPGAYWLRIETSSNLIVTEKVIIE